MLSAAHWRASNGHLPPLRGPLGETALDLLSQDGDRWERTHALRVRGSICRLLGRTDESRAALEESVGLFEELRRASEARLVRQELALLAIEARDLGEARRHLKLLQEASDDRSATTGR